MRLTVIADCTRQPRRKYCTNNTAYKHHASRVSTVLCTSC